MSSANIDGTTSQENYIEELKQSIKATQEVVNKVTEKARTKQSEYYDDLVKILAFDGKHKIEDRFKQDSYTVVGQPNPEIPVFYVKSKDGSIKRLHRNRLFHYGSLTKNRSPKKSV